jgi:alkylation response protein AidB-like acyl-CoA dehydrogenase
VRLRAAEVRHRRAKEALPAAHPQGDDFWCQGYSEPGSGSDLASLKTRAERKGDHYLVNGQKIWTTLGHYGDWIFCLVRTDPGTAKKQEGISFLLIDMKTPGITVRPLILMDGGHEVNEVFFDDVKVPLENLVFEENKGWTVAKYLLGHERMGSANVGASKRELSQAARRSAARDEKRPAADRRPALRDRLSRVEIELHGARAHQHALPGRRCAAPASRREPMSRCSRSRAARSSRHSPS